MLNVNTSSSSRRQIAMLPDIMYADINTLVISNNLDENIHILMKDVGIATLTKTAFHVILCTYLSLVSNALFILIC